MASMIIRVGGDHALMKTIDTVTPNFTIEVYPGHVSAVTINSSSHIFTPGVSNVNLQFENVIRTNWLGKIEANQKMSVYGAKRDFSDHWGIGGIPYRTDDGKDVYAGCHGDIRFFINDPMKAYEWLALEKNRLDGEPICTQDVWDVIHSKMDPIVKKYIRTYYSRSQYRDGSDFDEYRNAIISELTATFRTHGIEINDFIVDNIANPFINTQNGSGATVTAGRKEINNTEIKCVQCGLINEPDARYCIRCGEKLN